MQYAAVAKAMLSRLSLLAKNGSPEKRRELMVEVTDIFLDGAEIYSDHELFLFSEILSKLLDDVDLNAKISLSTKIAAKKKTPRDLVLLLANHEIEVAEPVLQQSPVLTESDLVGIVNSKTTNHRLAISKREHLTIVATDALMAHGEQPVFHSLCDNSTAHISHNGFELLAGNAKEDAVLRTSLSNRPDMPADVMEKVLKLLPQNDQKRLQSLVAAHGETAADHLFEEVMRQSPQAEVGAKTQRQQAIIVLGEILAKQSEIGSAVGLICKEDRILDACFVIASIANIPESVVVSAMLNVKGHAIAMLCRALGFSPECFQMVVTMRQKRLRQKGASGSQLVEQFRDLDIDAARRTLRYLKVRLQMLVSPAEQKPGTLNS